MQGATQVASQTTTTRSKAMPENEFGLDALSPGQKLTVNTQEPPGLVADRIEEEAARLGKKIRWRIAGSSVQVEALS